MREPKTADETMVFHGWVDACYRKYRAWKRMSSAGTAKDDDRSEYREAIGEVKAYRAMLEALFNWPTYELEAHKQEIHARVLAENAETQATASALPRITPKHITPVVGRTYRNAAGGDYTCVELLADERPVGGILRRVSDGYTLRAHDICENPDGTVCWAYSTGGHWPDMESGSAESSTTSLEER